MSLLKKIVRYELRLWKSLAAWTIRRPPFDTAADDAAPYRHDRAAAPTIWVFIGVSAVEVVVAHMLLMQWETIRNTALFIGIWGLLWMIGLLASLKMHPHVVTNAGVRVRHGVSIDFTIPMEAIAGIRHQLVNLPNSRTVHLNSDGAVVHIGVTSQTNARVDLVEPITLALPKGSEAVATVHFYADDSRALVADVQRRREPTVEGVAIDGRTEAGKQRR